MDDSTTQLEELKRRIENIIKKQEALNEEVRLLMAEFNRLKARSLPTKEMEKRVETVQVKKTETNKEVPPKIPGPDILEREGKKGLLQKDVSQNRWEEFIGGNILSKVGIVITIVGIFIGVKYAIDHNLISPLTRILAGYILGSALIGIALKLRKKYESFSAVLMGGGIAVFYFVTYIAYGFYNLFPQIIAFLIMLICTSGVIWASFRYKNQVIAILGLLGAYAIPVLLSDGSGRYEILFGYVSIINVGIMIISFRQNWKFLFYSAFGITWLIFFSWYMFNYNQEKHFVMGLLFLAIFFLTFYITFLAYKLIRKEQYGASDVVLLLLNSFIFYGLGYSMLDHRSGASNYLGLYTIINAAAHFSVVMIIKKMKLADKALFYLLLGLVLIFITIAIPVQFDGNWVTLLWAGEAVLLFYIGRKQSITWYEKIAIPLQWLAFFSLLQDWNRTYNSLHPLNTGTGNFTPVLNVNFISSLLVIGAMGLTLYIANNVKHRPNLKREDMLVLFYELAAPVMLVVIAYWSIFLEVNEYFNVYRVMKGFETETLAIKYLWLLNYSFAYVSLLAFLNQRYFRNKKMANLNIIAGSILWAIFLLQGLFLLGELRSSYTEGKYVSNVSYYLRYICFAFMGLWIVSLSRYNSWNLYKGAFVKLFAFVLHVSVLSVICNEFICQMDLFGYQNQYKLGLSIICGLYAVFLIVLGIWKKKQYLRIGAILLFGLTLVKLFFYDIAELSTISKTIVLLILGALLLVAAFLYNKYKHIILVKDNLIN